MRAFVFALASVAVSSLSVTAETIDQVVATVDDEPILQSELMVEIAPLIESLRASAATPEQFQQEVDDAMRQALDQAVEQRLLYREAELKGLQIDDAAIDDRIDKIKAQYKTNDEFLNALRDAGETMSDFRERLRRQIIAISMGMEQRRTYEDQAVVSESEIAQYYQDHQDEFSHGERIKVRRIFLSTGASSDEKAKGRARLESLKEELTLGADFSELAQAHSAGPEASSGGLVGWVERGDLVPQLEEAVFALQAGEVSAPIEVEEGVLLLKAEERVAAGTMTLDEARTEIEPILRGEAADVRYQKWINDLRDRRDVRVLL